MLTVAQLAKISENPDPVAFDLRGDLGALVPEMRKGKITTRPRVSAFLGNIVPETDRLKTLEEYGDRAYFESFLGSQHMYHGRGYIMNTWKAAYAALSEVLGVDLVKHPDLLATRKDLAAKAAVWFWTKNNVNRYADAGNFEAVCSIVNRGQVVPTGPINGWSDRVYFHKRALSVLPKDFTLDAQGSSPGESPAKQRPKKATPKKEQDVPKKPAAKKPAPKKPAPKKGVPGVAEYKAFIDWLRPAIGKTPYWIWEEGIIPDGPGAFATNKPVPSIEFVKGEPGIFCAGVTNLMLRFVGKRVPTKGNHALDGGIAAYFSGVYGPGYYSDYDEPFDKAKAKKWADETGLPVMVGKGYRGHDLDDQGHVALVLPKYRDGKYYVLQSYGPKWPGLNWDHTIEDSNEGGYYEAMVHPRNYFAYRGDEY